MFSTKNKTSEMDQETLEKHLLQYEGKFKLLINLETKAYESSNKISFNVTPERQMHPESDLNITQLIASQNDSHNEYININLSTVKMTKSPISINLNLLQTDIWYTSFGMSVKDM